MQRKKLTATQCPVARSLERVGEWWNILILRDALHGLTRFDEFQKSLDIAPNMLTRRLQSLVDAGLLERRRYSEHPPRYEYVLTERGRDFRTVLVAFMAWGNRHFAPEGECVQVVNSKTGEAAEPIVVDRTTGERLDSSNFTISAGPGANERTRWRMQFVAARRAGAATEDIPAWNEYLRVKNAQKTRKRARHE